MSKGKNTKGYNTNLASEFYILSMLYRKGFDAHITLGSRKSVDIIIKNGENRIVTVDVKGIRGKSTFPIDNLDVEENNPYHFIVFVSFVDEIYDEKSIPEVYIVPLQEIRDIVYINPKGNRQGVKLKTLRANKDYYQGNWDLLRSYGAGFLQTDMIDKMKWFEFLMIYNGMREGLLSFEYFSRTLSLLDFIQIQSRFKVEYPIDLNALYQNYSEYMHLHDIVKLRERVTELSNIPELAEHLGYFDRIIEARREQGEEDLEDSEMIMRVYEPLNKKLIKYISETGTLHRKRERDDVEKLKTGV